MSSESVKVISASNPKPWEHGIVYYEMVFERDGKPFHCDWGTKGGEPQPGEVIEGEFSRKDDGSWKFTKGSKDKPSPRKMDFGGTAKESKGWKPREPRSQYDPEDMARQTRSAAQDRALKALGLGGYPSDGDWDLLKEAITEWTKWFEDQVIEAGQAAAQAQGIATPSNQESAASPPSRAPLGSEQPPASQGGDASAKPPEPGKGPPVAEGVSMNFGTPSEQDEHRMDDALYNAGINDFDERRWLTEAWRNLPDDRRKACLGGLISGDIETPPKTLKGLQKEAGPMPASFRDDNDPVPF